MPSLYAPWSGRNIGIEIEVNKQRRGRPALQARSLKTAVMHALVDVGAPAGYLNTRDVGYYKSDGSTWDIKTDATSGWEVASRAIQLNDFGENEELARVCHHLERIDAAVNNSCGLHIHIETRDLTWMQLQNLVWLWARYEPFWFSLVPAYRRMRTHCQPICTAEIDGTPGVHWPKVQRLITGQRDVVTPTDWPRISLNLIPWWRSGRIEVRLHHGTISYQEMREWAMLMLSLVERAKSTTAFEPYVPYARVRPLDTDYIGSVLGLTSGAHPISRDLLQWIEGRRQAYNADAPRMGIRLDGADPLSRVRTLARQAGARVSHAANRGITREAESMSLDERTAQQLLRENARVARGRRRR